MKKLLAFSLPFAVLTMVSVTEKANAQSAKMESIIKIASDTATNTDTVIVPITRVGSKVKSIAAVVKRLNGSISSNAYVLLQGSIDGNEWFDVNTDTLSVSNQATNKKLWRLTSTDYRDYRLWYKSTGTQTSTLWIQALRRPDE